MLNAVILGDAIYCADLHDVVIAGGAESYSSLPIRMRGFADGRPIEAYEHAVCTLWPDRDPGMAAQPQLAAEITPVAGLRRDSFTRDLTPRHCLRAKAGCGSTTAAYMVVAADGAAFVLMVSERFARTHSGSAAAVLAGATLGADPLQPGLAPVPAVAEVLGQTGLAPRDPTAAGGIEDFAVQAIACQRGAGLPEEIANRHGGALECGHPIGAS
ncbi:hypothetical protein [Leisingera daeponensis]|uniref:hypothetical protein n=1 Tax=Leisingera daeponensis TaxID=405746 RepID=UPI001C9572EB|nr:hypothetical protein [Leisingera daeponensis]MBY6059297.1 hypothetical protein [Leisingera daeponensis]